MRLSDLLGSPVHDEGGTSLGKLVDLRVVRDADGGLRVEALLVGRGGVAERLGYVRHQVRGPWLLAAVARRVERELEEVLAARVVDWRSGDGSIRLGPP